MKRLLQTVCISVVIGSLSCVFLGETLWASCGGCGSSQSHKPSHHEVQREKKPEVIKDPICGMRLDEVDQTLSEEFQGKTYFFCSRSCKREFQERIGKK